MEQKFKVGDLVLDKDSKSLWTVEEILVAHWWVTGSLSELQGSVYGYLLTSKKPPHGTTIYYDPDLLVKIENEEISKVLYG